MTPRQCSSTSTENLVTHEAEGAVGAMLDRRRRQERGERADRLLLGSTADAVAGRGVFRRQPGHRVAPRLRPVVVVPAAAAQASTSVSCGSPWAVRSAVRRRQPRRVRRPRAQPGRHASGAAQLYGKLESLNEQLRGTNTELLAKLQVQVVELARSRGLITEAEETPASRNLRGFAQPRPEPPVDGLVSTGGGPGTDRVGRA